MSTIAGVNFPPSAAATPACARHPLRRRLWKCGIAAAAVLSCFVVFEAGTRLRSPSTKLALGHDLIPSYAAGVLVREGRPRAMYDREALSAVEFRMMREADLDIDPRFGAWLNPPFYAWPFALLSALPYRTAAAVFLSINLLLFAISLVLLARLLLPQSPGDFAPGHNAAVDWRTFGLVPLLVLLPFPFWQVMGHQQNTFISLLLLLISVTCWRGGKGFAAGAVAGLLFFKPQLAAVFAAVLIVCQGWRALAGLAVTGIALLALTHVTMPECLCDYVHRLPPILHWLQMELPYNWGRQVTLQSFWRLIIQGHVRGETIAVAKILWWLSSGAIFIGMMVAVRHYRSGNRDPISRDRLIAAAIASMPMLMPYYMDYDLLLLAVPAVLLATEWTQKPALIVRRDHWLFAAWVVLCVETHFNPGIAGNSHWNLAVPLLALISILHIARCIRPRTSTATDGRACGARNFHDVTGYTSLQCTAPQLPRDACAN